MVIYKQTWQIEMNGEDLSIVDTVDDPLCEMCGNQYKKLC